MGDFPGFITGEIIDGDGTDNVFETSQAITDLATLYFELDKQVEIFELSEIRYYMNPTNAVTYQLYLLEGPHADDVTQLSKVVHDSGAAQAKGTLYPKVPGQTDKLPRICKLDTPGRLYYLLDWSAAPGNTPGLINIRGRRLA